MTKINARLIAVTQPTIQIPAATPEGVVAYCGRVSNQPNQENPDYKKLFKTCFDNGHWSFFEMANAIVEVEAPRDITRQLLRHRSFSFQEFSQRYSDDIEFTDRDFRRQDTKNRQNSIDDLDSKSLQKGAEILKQIKQSCRLGYEALREGAVAKECARVILPEGLTMSRLYVNGTLRSWMTYLSVREDPTTQKEHQILAGKIRVALEPAFPVAFSSMVGSDNGKKIS